MDEVIEVSGNYRVRLVMDDEVVQPDGDAYEPALFANGWAVSDYRNVTTSFMDKEVTAAFLRACRDFGVRPFDAEGTIVERYMRIFWDTEFTATDSRIDRYYNVVLFDTPSYRNHIGRAERVKPLRGDWGDYLDGEVYGYVVEERHIETVTVTNGWGQVVREGENESWDEVDSCWGIYGREYAEERAREALAEHVPTTRGLVTFQVQLDTQVWASLPDADRQSLVDSIVDVLANEGRVTAVSVD